ncbi:stAR-related lipid transfer protein 4 isoform X2 [Brachyhypopomus gauderio]|uniref:stAR-related lipid transfer protein 4 isoform X2 n=1 Tax=Brachyhypopomus gauderio TaxID=698409 RepID=UPI0040437385
MGSVSEVNGLKSSLEETLISYHNLGENEWRLAKKAKDVTVWRKPSTEFSGFLYKAQGLVKENPNRIVDYIRPGPYRLNWDSLMTSMDIVKTFDKVCCVLYRCAVLYRCVMWCSTGVLRDALQVCCVMRYMTAGQLWNIIAPREFVDFSYTTEFQDGLLSCGVSVSHDEHRHSCVRGFNHPCGWFCVPVEGGGDSAPQSLLTGYIQTDLRGMIPQSAVDTAMASSLVNFYSDLRGALKT